jgi:hypothetical protein
MKAAEKKKMANKLEKKMKSQSKKKAMKGSY